MAPNGEASSAVAAVAPFLAKLIGGSDVLGHVDDDDDHKEMEQLTTTTSGNGGGGGEVPAAPGQEQQLQVVVVEEAECECCGMSEECTPEYIRGVRARFSGR
uniref:Uncharacterized protein n=1 Tax=Oryza brachyantha TaxID=4533 RepID=J3LB36_ORYBR